MNNRRFNTFWLVASPSTPPRQIRRYPADWRDSFFAALEQERTIYRAAQRVGVQRGSVYYHRTVDPDFAARLAEVLAGTTTSKES